MAIDIETKKQITADWLGAFPELSVFAQNKLYKVIGCSIVGIELIKLPNIDEYRPYFAIYPLWEQQKEVFLSKTYLLRQIFDKRGLQFSIPYLKHRDLVGEAVKCVQSQIQISLNGNVELNSWFGLIDERFNDILVQSSVVQQVRLLELKFYSALYVGQIEYIRNVSTEIQQRKTRWNLSIFEGWFGKYQLWLQTLHENQCNPEEFFSQIATNMQQRKIARLRVSDLQVSDMG